MADQEKDNKGWWVDLMESMKPTLESSLAKKRPFEQWYAAAFDWVKSTAANGNVKWSAVTRIDIESAFIAAARLGLMVDGQECMVMVRGQKTPKVKCEVGAVGVVRMAGDAGIRINARTIREGDRIDLDEGTGVVHHTPAWLIEGGKSGGKSLGYYAVAIYRDGRQVVRSMSYEDAQTRNTSSERYSPWKTHPDPMGEKSAILNIRKVLYLGDEIEGIISASGAETGDTWAASIEDEEASQEPQHPPQTTRDKVMAQAGRDEQDAAAEAGQEPEPEVQNQGQNAPTGGMDDGGPI